MSESATCTYCDQAMNPGTACTQPTYDDFPDHVERQRIPYDPDTDRTCHDCGAPRGGLHHPGCDMERCPGCGGQAIACDCCGEGDDR